MSLFKDLNVKNTFNYIVHLADIHIHNSIKRLQEYEFIFNNLYMDIYSKQKLNKKNTCIIIAGDIFHDASKEGKLTPNAIQMFKQFIKKINNLGTIVIIPGNHDNNITYQYNTSSDKIDTLTSILYNNILENTFYLKNTGKYKLGNLLLYHTSVFDIDKIDKPNQYQERLKYLIKRSNEKDSKHIGILHCSIDGQILQNNYVLKGCSYKISDIEQYDICCLGDTHKYQFLGKHKNIAFPNSLIQQHHGESLNNHGYILWDLSTFKGQLQEIKNEYGFVTVTTTDNIEDIEFPKKSRIKLKYKYDDTIDISTIKSNIEKKTTIVSWKEEWVSCEKNDRKYIEKDVTNEEKILKYIEEKIPGDKNTEKRNLIFSEILKKIRFLDQNIGRLSCKLVSLKFVNFQCYKGTRFINFDSYENNSTVAITGDNTTGKSTIIRALGFVIWGADKGKSLSLINNLSKNMKTILIFKHDTVKYRIIRQLTMKQNKSPGHKLIFEVLKGDEWNNESVKYTKENQKEINKYFGEKITAKQTWFSEQGTQNQFINANDSYYTFQNFIGVDIFKQIYNDINNKKKNVEKEFTLINNKISEILFTPEDKNLESNLIKYENEKKMINNQINKLEKQLDGEREKEKFGTFKEKNEWNEKIDICKTKNKLLKNKLTNITDIQYSNEIEIFDINLEQCRLNKNEQNRSLPIKPLIVYDESNIIELEKELSEIDDSLLNYNKLDTIEFDMIESKIKLDQEREKKSKYDNIKKTMDNKKKKLNSILIDLVKYDKNLEKIEELNNKKIINEVKILDFIFNINNLNKYLLENKKNIKNSKQKENEIIKYKNIIDNSKKKLVKLPDKNDIKNGYELLEKYKLELDKINTEIETVAFKLEHLEQNNEKHNSFIFDINCDHCINNKKLLKRDKIIVSINLYKNKLNDLDCIKQKSKNKYNKYKIYESYFKNYELNIETENIIRLYEDKININKLLINTISEKINENKKMINEYYKKKNIYDELCVIKKEIESVKNIIEKQNKIILEQKQLEDDLNKLYICCKENKYCSNQMEKLSFEHIKLQNIYNQTKRRNKLLEIIKNIKCTKKYDAIIKKIKIIDDEIKNIISMRKKLIEKYEGESNIKNQIKNYNKEIVFYENKINQYNNYGGYMKENLDKLKKKISKLRKNIETINKIIGQLEILIQTYTNNLKKSKMLKQKLVKISKELIFINDYCDIVNPISGYPQKLIKYCLKEFEKNINKFINITGFNYKVRIELPEHSINIKSQSKRLNFIYIKNNQIFSVLSGAEKAIFNFAIQTSLGYLHGNLAPPLEIMDEGFSTLDKEHSQVIPNILNSIKSQFNLILYISHNDYIKNSADYNIRVKKIDNNSYFECM